jgi:chromate transporter
VLSEPLRWHPVATAALASFFVLLITLPLLSAAWDNGLLAVLDRFYRAGALVFGGGHVVLPLLRSEVVPPGWVSDAQFLAGYGAAQGVPGPLFSFAAYLGTAMTPGPFAWAGGLWALLAIFLPAWLLIGGALPFWDRLRAAPLPQAALRGANAAVVGILLAALYNPVMTQAIFSPRDFAVALLAFAALMVWNTPAWAVVILTAVAQQWVF